MKTELTAASAVLTLTLVALLAAPALAQDTSDREAALEKRIAELENVNNRIMKRLNSMESEQEGNWLNERRAEEVKALVRDVLEDADTRASLQGEGQTAGHNGSNFYIASEDGTFLMQIAGLVQVRYIANFRNGDAPAPPVVAGADTTTDRARSGFEISRAKLEFAGYIGSPRFQYLFRFGPDREDNEVLGERIVLGYQLSDTITIWGGEDKAAFLREEIISPAHQLAVERSLVNEVFTIGYIQGMWVTWEAHEDLNVYVSINDGARSGEADNEFNSAYLLDGTGAPAIHKPFDLDKSDFAVTARADWRVWGDWAQWEDFTSWSGEERALFIGAAVHYQHGERGTKDLDNDDFIVWTVDISYEENGFNAFVAGMGVHTNFDKRDTYDAYGLLAQAGYQIIPDKLEPFVRYEYIDLHDKSIGADTFNALTFGVNYYFIRHQAKFTFDVVWLLDTLPDASTVGVQDNDGTNQTLGSLGLIPDSEGDNNQVSLRAQFQLMF